MRKCRKFSCFRRFKVHAYESKPEFLGDIKKPRLDSLPLQDKSKLMQYYWKSSVNKVKGILNVMRALKMIHL